MSAQLRGQTSLFDALAIATPAVAQSATINVSDYICLCGTALDRGPRGLFCHRCDR